MFHFTFQVLKIPVDQIRFSSRVPIVNAVKINDSYIVVSFHHHPEICVWDTATRVLVTVFFFVNVTLTYVSRICGAICSILL